MGKRPRCSRAWQRIRKLKGLAVPATKVRLHIIGAVEKIEHHLVRRRGLAHFLVGKDELAEIGVVAGGSWRDGGVAASRRLGNGEGIKGRFQEPAAAWPEAGLGDLLMSTQG